MVKRELLGFFQLTYLYLLQKQALIKPVMENINPVKGERIFGFDTIVSINKGKIGPIILTENCTKNSIKNVINNCPLLKNKAALCLNGMVCFFLAEGVNFFSTKKKIKHPAIKSRAAVIQKEFRKHKKSARIPPNKGPKKLPKKPGL